MFKSGHRCQHFQIGYLFLYEYEDVKSLYMNLLAHPGGAYRSFQAA